MTIQEIKNRLETGAKVSRFLAYQHRKQLRVILKGNSEALDYLEYLVGAAIETL